MAFDLAWEAALVQVPWPRLDPYEVTRRLLGPSLRLAFPAGVEGLAHVPGVGPAVLAPNHVSIMDSILLSLVVPRRISFIAKAEHFDDWKSGWAMRLTGQIPLRRGTGMAVGRALSAASEVLSRGGIVAIYPEGTRSRDGRLHRGNAGPAWLAMATGAPIVPVGLVGTAEVHAPGEPLPHPFRRATVRFGAPIWAPQGPHSPASTRRVRAELTDEVMAGIAALSGQELGADWSAGGVAA